MIVGDIPQCGGHAHGTYSVPDDFGDITEHMFLPVQKPFRLELGWLRPQAFRWLERDDWYYGVVNAHPIKVRQSGGGIEFRSNVAEESVKPHVESYFRLHQDIWPVHAALRQVDRTMAGLVDRYGGMRLLRQDPWECLVAYICSQNNSIDRIATIVDLLAYCYGDPLTLEGVRLNTFPSPQHLAEAGRAELDGLKLGVGSRQPHLPDGPGGDRR